MKMKYKIVLKENTWSVGSRGWGNGYVDIPEGSPLFGVDYEHIDVDVHGGLTYGELHLGFWRVGFDTTHYADTLVIWPEERVLKETENLRDQLIKLSDEMSSGKPVPVKTN